MIAIRTAFTAFAPCPWWLDHIRHAEIQRLQLEDVQIEDDLIEVHPGKAKTASRRTIPITPNLKAWLMSFREETGPVTV